MKWKQMITAGMALCLLLSGCGSRQPSVEKDSARSTAASASIPETEASVQTPAAESELTNALIMGVVTEESYYAESMAAKYAAAYPEAEVSVQYYPDIAALNVAIATGDSPDLLYISPTSTIPYSSYRTKGLFLDLSRAVSVEGMYPELVSAYTSENGSLYSCPLLFEIDFLVVPQDVAQGRAGWTLEEFLESAGDSAGIFIYDEYTLATTLMDMNLEQFLDPETGLADLDCQQFYDMLGFLTAAYQAPEDQSDGNSNWHSCAAPTDLLSIRQIYGSEWTCIGWPTPDRTGYPVKSTLEFAVLTSGRNQGQAVQFLNYFLTEAGQEDCLDAAYGLPVCQAACDSLWQEAIAKEKVTAGPDATEEEALEAAAAGVPREDYEAFQTLLARISCVSRTNQDVNQILKEELDAFFSGDKTKEEIAAILENRLNIYLSEQA